VKRFCDIKNGFLANSLLSAWVSNPSRTALWLIMVHLAHYGSFGSLWVIMANSVF